MESKNKCLTCFTSVTSRWYKNITQCAGCNKKEWYKKNKEKALKKSCEWNAENKYIKKQLNDKWYSLNRKKRLAKNIKYKENNPEYFSKWRTENKGVCRAYYAKYRSTKINATLKGYEGEIQIIYEKAVELQKQDGVERHVHHIIPLQAYNYAVSGLHVPWNLKILTKDEHYEAHRELGEIYGKKTSK